MKALDLPDIFPPVTRAMWETRAQKDLGEAHPLSDLNWNYADRLSIAPYYTREDLDAAPRASQSPVRWQKAASWSICEPVSLEENLAVANKLARSALQSGSDAIVFEGSLSRIASPSSLSTLLEGLSIESTALHFYSLKDAHDDRLAFARCLGDRIGQAEMGRISFSLLPPAFGETAGPAIGWLLAHPVRALVLISASAPPAGQNVLEALLRLLLDLFNYTVCLQGAGLSLPDVLKRLQVVMPIGPSFYLEIAKFRAIRWLIGLLVRFFEPEFDEPLSVPIMADTTSNGYSSSAAQENLLRGTTRAIAAVAGGCDALIVRPYEVENDAPTGHARRMARNTQLILKHEAYLDRFTDPGSGSYYIEAITRQLVERVWDKFLASPDGPGPAPRVSTAV